MSVRSGCAVHTAAEPDPDLLALANDPNVEVLIFKMAVATGFDAPRASTLCALRPVRDAGFGLQVIGRIMRVHLLLQQVPNLPALLDTGAVFLADPDGQAGLSEAATRIKAIRDRIRVAADAVRVFQAEVGDGVLTFRCEDGQVAFDLTSPEPAEPDRHNGSKSDSEVPRASAGMPEAQAMPLSVPERFLFGALMESLAASTAASSGMEERSSAASAFQYPRRAEVPLPVRLRTERMPPDPGPLLDSLVRNVRFGPEEFATVRRGRMEVERRETDVFDAATPEVRRAEQAAISDLFAREGALRALRVSDHIDPTELARRLVDALRDAFVQDGQETPDDRALRRGLNVILARNPRLCRDALRKAMAAHVEGVDAAGLPASLPSQVALPSSPLNLYRVLPSGMNSWELAFADWLDLQSNVLWWLRNAQRDGHANG